MQAGKSKAHGKAAGASDRSRRYPKKTDGMVVMVHGGTHSGPAGVRRLIRAIAEKRGVPDGGPLLGFGLVQSANATGAFDSNEDVMRMPSDLIRRHISESVNPRERATILGAPPGRALTRSMAERVLKAIIGGASDLFPTSSKAEAYLNSIRFGEDGKTPIELVEAGSAATVISRLEELRFGSQG